MQAKNKNFKKIVNNSKKEEKIQKNAKKEAVLPLNNEFDRFSD